jgi:cytoskeletal protein CcmA (bactofilin family)
MFSKASKQASANTESARSTAKASVPSIISADLRINGDLICSSDIQVDGWVEGDIQSRSVVVGEGATVHGSLQAEKVRICGVVNGAIKADQVILEKTAKVTGDVHHKSLAIEQGAQLEGMCKRLDAPVAVQGAKPVSPAANEAKPLPSGEPKPLGEKLAAIG